MANNKNPWMALEAYQESDEYKFKGRDNDSENLLTILKQNECVVCYAASGDGKSSLINAGVCPKMRKSGMFPIKIVFTTAEYEGHSMPIMQNGEKIDFNKLINAKIKESISDYEIIFAETHNIESNDYKVVFEPIAKYNTQNVPSGLSDNLWWKLRTETIQIPFGEYDYIPVLIFDQFEEIFRAKWKEEFFQWLEMLMKDVCPTNIAETIDDHNIEIPSKKLFKTIFSMRYEYVGELDYWCSQKTFIPQMMHNRYFLKPLTIKDAIDIIESQDTTDPISKIICDHSNILVQNICNKESNEVSPIILSMLCYGIYEKLNDNGNFSITEEAIYETISSFYDKTLAGIKCKGSDAHISKKHIRIIENALVDENGHRLRLPVNITDLKAIEFNENYCDALKDAHLIRIYKINDESYVELIHDRIAEIIVDKRAKRALRNKMYYKWAILGVIALALAVFGIYLMNKPSENNPEYTLLVKAKDSLFIEGDYWEARLTICSLDGKPLKLEDSIISDTIVKKWKEEVSLTFTKKEIKSLKKIILQIRPVNGLCLAKDDTINLKQENDTIYISIVKNKEETITINGSVSASIQGCPTLNRAMVIMGKHVTYTNNGEFSLTIPRGTQLKTIYAFKEGYKPKIKPIGKDTAYITISLDRDTTYKFEDRWRKVNQLWVIASDSIRNNKKYTSPKDQIILDDFHIRNKEGLKRQFEPKGKNDTIIKYVFYDPEKKVINNGQAINKVKQNNNNENDKMSEGAVRTFIGYDMKNHYLLEGTMTLIEPDTLWKVEVDVTDSIFNTKEKKGILIKKEVSKFIWEN